MKVILTVIVLFCLTSISQSHSRWSRRRNNYRSHRFNYRRWHISYNYDNQRNIWRMQNDACWSYGWKQSNSKVIACEFNNSEVVEKRMCPNPYTCTQGPLNVLIDGKTAMFKFCSLPALKEDACKMKHSYDEKFEIRLRTCPLGTFCEAGPLRQGPSWCSYDYFFCGKANATIPGLHFYEDEISKKACLVNGAPVDNDCGICDGLSLTLPRQTGGTSTLKFCEGRSDDNFKFLKIWGTVCYGGSEWNPEISTSPVGSGGAITPTTQPPNKRPVTETTIQNSTLAVNTTLATTVSPTNETASGGAPNTGDRPGTNLDKLPIDP